MSFFRDQHGLSERKACQLASYSRSSYRRRSLRAEADEPLRERLLELASQRPRFGYRRLHVLLRREGWQVNHKKILRLCREEHLLVRTRRRRTTAAQIRVPLGPPSRVYERWSADFMSDQLASGQRFRVLNVIDQLSRKCLASEARFRFPAEEVTPILERLIEQHGCPDSLTVDNGTEFTSRHFDAWAHRHGVQLDFIEPGRPVENALVESFNGRLRDECLNANWFSRLREAQACLEAWRQDYNHQRPHSSLGGLAPVEYVAKLLAEAGN